MTRVVSYPLSHDGDADKHFGEELLALLYKMCVVYRTGSRLQRPFEHQRV